MNEKAKDRKRGKDGSREHTPASPVCYARSVEVRPEFQESDEDMEQDHETGEKKSIKNDKISKFG